MKTKIFLTAAALIIISAVNSNAQSWNVTGNAGINPSVNFIGTADNHSLVIRSNNVNRIFVDSTGKVGIGTSAPSAQLHFNGGKFILNGTSTTNSSLVKIKSKLEIQNGTTSATFAVFDAVNLRFGIGTATPTTALDVNGVIKGTQLLVGTATGATGYIASIGGKIIAEEVRVDLQTIWPDFVFDANYNLMSLGELNVFVSSNKHLPGIPSADKIKGSGIMLGEMQTKTLEKVEEAMLYIIQLDKENNELKAQVQNLQKQINELKK